MGNLFKSIIGEQLSSVEFVQDYLQLHFDGSTLTFYSWPEITKETIVYNIGHVAYRNMLCEMIGHKVSNVVLTEKTHVELFFDDNNRISLSLVRNQSNIGLTELVYFVNVDKEWLVLD